MRHFLILLAYVTSLAAAAASCGARSDLGGPSGSVTGAGGATGGGGTTLTATTGGGFGGHGTGGVGTGGGSTGGGCGKCPAAITCAGKGLDCGEVGDGCGCLLHCGTCTKPNETCGGGAKPNVCGTSCVPTTCAALGLDCGLTGDGCDGTLDCGTCPGGKACGAVMANVCGTGPCKTCAQEGFNCGQEGDGCGGAIACGDCPAGLFCGGGMPPQAGVCGAKTCTPKTCAQQSFDCGLATDTCGGIINCGACAGNQVCGESNPNACGVSGACTGLCLKQVTCPGTATTSVSGTVFAPQGADPLFGTLVYVPNGPVLPFAPGVSCGDCSAQVTGAPLVSAITGVDGTFTITNMPVGANIPLVIQNGRWRRQFVIPNVPACVDTKLPAAGMAPIRMPQTKAEGDIPLMAFVTGFADTLECALRKIGIADTEFSDPSGNGRVRFYLGGGSAGARYSPATPSEDQLWGSQASINAYDMVYFACQGHQYDKSTTAQNVVINYANAGGRIFATHYSYVWLYNDAPFSGTASWSVDPVPSFANDPGTGIIDTTFPKGLALAEWLKVLYPASALGKIPLNSLRHDFTAVVAPSLLWIHVDDPKYAQPVPMHYTFDTPIGAPPAQQCGRVLYDDFHVEDAMGMGATFPQECMAGPVTPQEKMLEFMIFDLGSCVGLTTCKVGKTCAQQNVQCGPAGDGCGNILQCGMCPAGQICAGGACVDPCTPKTCAQQGFTCGMQGDTCGHILSCGPCPPNEVCSNGACSKGPCVAKTCGQQGFTCGPQGDGCGNILSCGACPPDQVCSNGVCKAPPCTPKSCAQQGYNCGLASDTCNGVINCGTCAGLGVCGGGIPGLPNVCSGGA